MENFKIKKSFVTNIIVIFILFNILSILMFTSYIDVQEQNRNLEYAKQSLMEIVGEKSDLISIRFDRITNQANMMGLWVEKLLKEEPLDSCLKTDYIYDKEGMLIRKKNLSKANIEQSCVVIPKTTKITKDVIGQINLTEQLDNVFEQIIKDEEVTWAYIVTRDNLLRCSPFSDVSVFSSDHSQINDVFYTAANEKNDPEKEVIWTVPYLDYLGTGWTMTCSKPIYDANDKLYGVICLDISIDKLKEKYFKGFKLGQSGQVYWLENNGNIYYHPDYDKESAAKGECFEKNIFNEEKMGPNKKNMLEKVLNSKRGIENYEENSLEKILVHSPINGNKSSLIIEVDKKEFATENRINGTKLMVLILMNIMVAIFFAIILYYRFSRPMKNLVGMANKISMGEYDIIEQDGDVNGYYEISKLTEAFSTMNQSIKKHTKTLIEKNREINSILDTIDGILMIIDSDGNVKVVNKAIQNRECFRGLDRPIKCEEIIGDEQYSVNVAIQNVLENKLPYSEQVVVNGEVYKNVFYPIVNENNQVDQIIVSNECITKSILLEKELQQIEKMAGVGQLAAAIVHELKNSLALIKGAAYIMELTQGDTNKDQNSNIDEITTIKDAVLEAERVINTLLDFSRRERDEEELIHIETIINQILLLSKKEIIKKNIKIDFDFANDDYIYSSRREEMKVILQNVINNAIQAVEDDGKIAIRCFESDKKVTIKVKDNGEGIKVEPKTKILIHLLQQRIMEMGSGYGLLKDWLTV